MRIFKLSSLLAVAVVASALLFTGCVAKPKLDLNGVKNSPSANGNGLYGGENGGFGDDDLLVPGSNSETGEFPSPWDDDANAIGQGTWGGLDAPVTSGGDGDSFLKNGGTRWTDCVVYFAYDQYEVGPSERTKLDVLAQYLTEHPGKGVIVEGHTDERGSDEYNRALGERRALAVTKYLDLLGVSADRCKTISYGEYRLAVPGAASESDHQLNRRAEFLIGDL